MTAQGGSPATSSSSAANPFWESRTAQRLAVEATILVQSGIVFPTSFYFLFRRLLRSWLARYGGTGSTTGVPPTSLMAAIPFGLYYGYLVATGQLRGRNLPQISGDAASADWRNFGRYSLAAKYFDHKIVKAGGAGSFPGRQYLFAAHPHGVFVLSSLLSLASNGCGVDDDPDLRHLEIRFAVADFPFLVPLMREYALRTGAISPSATALRHNFAQGRSIGLVVGGPDEALLAGTGAMRLVLKDRKGFIRLALTEDVDVIPVLNFGENALYRQCLFTNLPLLRRLQLWQRRKFGFSMPCFYRKDFWKVWQGGLVGGLANFVGLAPTGDVKLRTLLGRPFDVSRFVPERYRLRAAAGSEQTARRRYVPVDQIPAEEFRAIVDAAHAAYLEELRALHAEWAPALGAPEDQELEFVTVKEARSLDAGLGGGGGSGPAAAVGAAEAGAGVRREGLLLRSRL